MARFGNFDQYLGNDGNPLVSGRLYFFETGTTTPKTTYADINNSIANTNPVILTASGRQPNVFFEGVAKAILTDSADVQIAVQDPVGETGTDFGNEWIATRIYSALDVVRGSDGIYYRSLVNANQNNNPVNTSGSWALLYSVQWNAGITYAVGALVTYDNLQYQSLQGTNLNQNPSTAGSYWVSLQFAWLSTITYAIHQNVIGTDGVLYTSLQNSNTNQVPASSAAWWVGSSAAAASSASAAATSATAAETAETNAETAETNAETAETAAVAAKDLAAQQATLAEAAAAAADATANAELWVSAGSYTAGQNRYSPINYLTYRAITTHSGVSTDPSLDATNWVAVFGASLSSNTFTGTQDFTGATVLGIDADPILGFANKSSWADGEQISIALDPSASAIAKAHVSVYEEVPQTGVTNNNWDAAAGSYTLEDSAYATSLSWVSDLADATFVDSFSISSQETEPRGLAFNTNGTKMFVVGRTGDDVNEYALTTGFDVSTASFTDAFSISSEQTDPAGIKFNTDGTKMFIVGGAGGSVDEYALSTGFDVSTSTFTNVYSLAAQENSPQGIAFNTDGTKMFIVGLTGLDVNEYTLSVGFDTTSTVTFVDSFSVSSQDTSPAGIVFNPDGTKMYVVGTTGQDVNEYTLTTGFDVSTASFTQVFSVSGQEKSPQAIAFNTNQTKMFILGRVGDDVNEYSLPLSKLALGTGSFASTDVGKTINVNSGALVLTATTGTYSETTTPSSIDTADSGDWSMFAVVYDADADVLETSNLVTKFDINSASYDSVSFSISGQGTTQEGLAFSTDGSKMYLLANNVFQYTLSTPFDLSTASYDSVSYTLGSETATPTGIMFNPDGSKMYVMDDNGNDVGEYALSTAWNVSTATYTDSLSTAAVDGNPRGMSFNATGDKFYFLGDFTNRVHQYSLSTAYDISTGTYDSVSFSVAGQSSTPKSILFSTDGEQMYILDTNTDAIYQYSLSTAFDISTAAYASISFSVASQDTTPVDIKFNDDGSRLYMLGGTGDSAYQYSTLSALLPTGYQPCISSNIDSTYWTDINALTATNAVGDGNVFYAVSNDARTTWSVLDNSNGVRSIARVSGGTWQYNSNTAYGSETWVAASTNTEVQALREAAAIASNQMNSTTLNAITDANQITLGNDLDFAAILYMDSGSTVPAYSGTAINYDANILNEVSYDYTIYMPTTSVVRVTAPSSGGPRNARVYISK